MNSWTYDPLSLTCSCMWVETGGYCVGNDKQLDGLAKIQDPTEVAPSTSGKLQMLVQVAKILSCGTV